MYGTVGLFSEVLLKIQNDYCLKLIFSPRQFRKMWVAIEFLDEQFTYSDNDIHKVRSVALNSYLVHAYFLYVRQLHKEDEWW
jgi:hypothetical protein